MTSTPKRRIAGLIGAVLLLAVLVLVLGIVTGRADLRAATSSTKGQKGDSLTALPTDTANSKAGAPTESGGEPFRTCIACHPTYERKPDPTGDLIFSHQRHTLQGIACATCHKPPLGHFGQPAPLMTTCLSCHQGDTAPNDCKKCHRNLEAIAPGLGKQVVHLKPDAKTRRTCEKCHDVNVWCEQCHGVAMPHPVAWKQIHGGYALKDPQVCEKCHQSKDKTFCVRCHGVEMPHPAYWYSNHGDIARTNSQTCTTCHPNRSFCQDCHHAGFSPTAAWASSQHGQAVAKKGTQACFVCHDQTFCERCHPTGKYKK